jgi:hypothetical protein
MSVITTTRTAASASAWLNLDALVDAPTRVLFDDLASEIETACYEHEQLLIKARAALALADQITSRAPHDLEATGGEARRSMNDGFSDLVRQVIGADRLWDAMHHLSEGFSPDSEPDWTPGGFRKGGDV